MRQPRRAARRTLISIVGVVLAGCGIAGGAAADNEDSTSISPPPRSEISATESTAGGTTVTAATPQPPKVLLVGDSTLLAVDSYGTAEGLRGFDAQLDVASCRTLGVPSCGDPPIPPNTVETIRAAPGPYDVVVVMAGYDEWWTSFPDSVRAVADEVRAKGATSLLFLTFREGVGYLAPDGRTASEAFERNNATLRELAASGEIPELVVADWYRYTSDVESSWLATDGIHLTPLGAWGVTDYISRWVAHLFALPCPASAADDPCANPDDVGPPDEPSEYVLR